MTNDQSSETSPAPKPGQSLSLIKALPAAVVTVFFIVFVFQNAERVEVDVLWWTFEAPRVIFLVLAAVSGVLIWELGRAALRHRRKAKRAAS